MQILTPIPRTVGKTAERVLYSGSWMTRLYQILLLALFTTIVLAVVAAGPGFFAASILGIVIWAVLGSLVQDSLVDWWDRRFYVIEI